MSPNQSKSFHTRINADGTDARAIDGALEHVKAENAEASEQADLDAIRALIQNYSGGFGTLNDTVKQYLRRWFVSQGGVRVAARVGHHSSSLVVLRTHSAESAFKGPGSAECIFKCPGSVRSAESDSVWATTRGVAVDDVSSQGFLEPNRGQSTNSSQMPLQSDDAPSMAGDGLTEVELIDSSWV